MYSSTLKTPIPILSVFILFSKLFFAGAAQQDECPALPRTSDSNPCWKE